jgi:hypothetical protein
VLAQQRLQVAGVDVEAAADDHVLAAVEQGQEAVGVEAPDVAGADEALARGVEPLGLARLLGLAVVAGHHAGRVAHHLAGLAGGTRARLVDQADVVALGRPAHGVQLVGVQVGFEDAGAAAFGHAVELGQAAGPARQHVGLELGAKRRAGAELGESAQVEIAELRQRHDALVLHRHQHGVRDAVLLGQLQVARASNLGISTTQPP